MKFLVPNYSCLQNPWLGGYRPKIPVLSVLSPQLNLLKPPRTKFLGTPLGCIELCMPLYIVSSLNYWTLQKILWECNMNSVWWWVLRYELRGWTPCGLVDRYQRVGVSSYLRLRKVEWRNVFQFYAQEGCSRFVRKGWWTECVSDGVRDAAILVYR